MRTWVPLVSVSVAALALAPLRAPALAAQEREARAGTLSIALLDVPVTEALARLSEAAGMRLVWHPEALGDRARVRISCRREASPAEEVLRCITREAGLDFYRLSSGTYVVIGASDATPGFVSLGGYVTDAQTGAPIPAASLRLAEDSRDAIAGSDGGFTVSRLRPGRYAVLVRAIGYRPLVTSLEVAPGGNRPARFALERAEAVMRPIVINGIRPGNALASLGQEMLGDSVARGVLAPSLFLPGTAAPLGMARRDGTGDLHLQGGDIGEHPWRLDGIPLYDVSALSGLVGVVAPDVVQQLTVRRAGFRASEGSFTAGVIDLTHTLMGSVTGGVERQLAVDPLAATGSVGVPLRMGSAEGRAMIAGRIGLWRWTAPGATVRALRAWSVPDPVLLARVSGFGALPGMSGLDTTRYGRSIGDERVSIGDVHAAAQLAWGIGQRLDVSAFSTGRSVAYGGIAPDSGAATLASTDDYAWRTTGAQLSHRWLIGTRVRQRVRLRAVRHTLQHDVAMSMAVRAGLGVSGDERNALDEVALDAEWHVAAGPRVDLTFGSEIARTAARIELANRVLRPLSLQASLIRASAFTDATVRLTPTIAFDAGLRVTQLPSGRTFGEPRLALRGEGESGDRPWGWRLAGGGYHQFVSQFDVASTMPVAFVPSARFWWPLGGSTPVAQAWHLAAEGVVQPAAGWELRAEGYLRWHPSLPMLDYGIMFDANSPTASLGTIVDDAQVIARSSGRALGAGVRVVRDARLFGVPWRAELAADVGRAERRFPSRFGGRLQSPPWLEPRRVQVASEWHPVSGLTLALRGRGIFGRPWALRQAYYDLFGAAPQSSGLPVDMPSMMRRPSIVELDLGAQYARRIGSASLEGGVSLTNATGRDNVLDYGLRRRSNATEYDMVPRFLPGRQLAFTLRLRG